ncbi:hypothetical protein CVS47_00750 [Microbacterium lemovicicum]|uniref:DUF2304 domain-containing protein n=1 Tax=Microbacterium lemovicicum TaxID=1072463 RepID=A0A3S9W7T3_9MICO|nr:DUF2304 domain-containing protein [Microbacterium lemovicicum]AZS36150.1 hypothetical protein CVS47_00750 [Microbacterium lemovicicum]
MIVFLGIALSLVLIVVVIAMLLTRRLREKYAALWLVIGVGVLVLGIFPQLLQGLTRVVGVELPANLLFAIAIVLLLGVALHLSWELSQAEEEIRRTAEEVTILRTQLEHLTARVDELDSPALRRPAEGVADAAPIGRSEPPVV